MLRATVVDNHIHDDADAFGAGQISQLAVFLIGAEAGVHLVEIGGRIAVVGVLVHVIFQQWVEPDGGEAQIGDVIQVVDDAFDIASVTAARLLAVGLFFHALYVIIGGVAIGETVGRDEVHGIGSSEALEVCGTRCTCLQLVSMALRNLTAFAEDDVKLACFCRFSNGEVDEEVIGVFYLNDLLDAHTRIIDGRLQFGYVVAMYQQLQCGVFHPYPPIGRLDALYLRLG